MRFAIKPTNNANDIHGSSGCKMLEMCLFLADIARASQTHDANSLRNGSFYPCSACVQRFEVVRFGTFTCLLECLIVLFRPNGDGATLTRRWRTQCAARAALTVLRREFDQLCARTVFCPIATGTPIRGWAQGRPLRALVNRPDYGSRYSTPLDDYAKMISSHHSFQYHDACRE